MRSQLWELEVVEGRRVFWDGPGRRARKYDLLCIGGGAREEEGQ